MIIIFIINHYHNHLLLKKQGNQILKASGA